MKLITLNTWMGFLSEDLLKFLATKKDQIDIFCFQEIYSEAMGKEEEDLPGDRNLDIYGDIAKVLSGHHGYFKPAHQDFYGQAMFIRTGIPVLNEGDFEIFKNPNDTPDMGTHSRNLQYATIQMGDKELTVANVHGLWNGQGKLDTPERILQSKNIREFMDQQNDPKILCGDFNLLPGTESLMIAGEGMVDLIAKYGITSTRTSQYTKLDKYADYVFTSPDIKVNNFEALPDEVSDHAALQLDFD